MTADVILHHYETSLFSEKVRLAFGLKGLTWRSVLISPVMPRPDLMPITGGYRRTPVMQIGADVYCDTQVILRELERRFPERTLYPGESEGLCWGLSMWTDRSFFQAAVGVVFGHLSADDLPPGFIEDREALSGRPFDLEAMRRRAPLALDQCRASLRWIERQLGDHRDWVLGAAPSLADLACFMNVWFLESAWSQAEELLGEFPLLQAWAGRVRDLGHGEREEASSSEALEIARRKAPTTRVEKDVRDPRGLEPGETVTVTPEDYGRVPVRGEIVSSSPTHVAVRRSDERTGELVVHFPRAGFVVERFGA